MVDILDDEVVVILINDVPANTLLGQLPLVVE